MCRVKQKCQNRHQNVWQWHPLYQNSEQALESSDPSVDTEPSVVTETPIYDKPERVKKKPSYLRDYIT